MSLSSKSHSFYAMYNSSLEFIAVGIGEAKGVKD